MYNKLPLIITLISCFFGFSQTTFKGVVTENDTSMNVTNAIIAIEGTAIAQRTDVNGAFLFTQTIPAGQHVVTISKEGYDTKYVLIEVTSEKNIIMDNILIEVNKKEKKRREKAIKNQQKEQKKAEKKKEKFLEKVKKETEKKQKALEKQKKKLLKKQKKNRGKEVAPMLDVAPIDSEPMQTVPEITDLQIKYGAILNVTPETIINTKLYEFIEDWDGTKYVLGGETRDGIDCSSFTQRLFINVYDIYLERTADKQYNSKFTERFSDITALREGDLIFFKGSGDNSELVVHVGLYLHNGYFVNATSYVRDTGTSGVKISNLSDPFWAKYFGAGGRRKDIK